MFLLLNTEIFLQQLNVFNTTPKSIYLIIYSKKFYHNSNSKHHPIHKTLKAFCPARIKRTRNFRAVTIKEKVTATHMCAAL